MPVSLAQFNPAADAQQVVDGTMTASSAILTSASGKFTAGDVGKMIHVQGAGTAGLKLVSSIASFQSATQVTLADVAVASISPGTASNGSGVTWGTDDGPVFQVAIDSIDNGDDLYIPAGNYLLSTPVYRDFSTTSPRLKMYGDGWGTRIYAAAYNPTNSTSHRFVSLIQLYYLTDFELTDMIFIGTPSVKVDFQWLIVLAECALARIDADFYWLSPLGPPAGSGGAIWAYGSGLRLNSRFRGCIGGDMVKCEAWRSFVDEGSIFIDWGIIDGYYTTKYMSGAPRSWINILTPKQAETARTNMLGQGKVVLRNTSLDEDGGIPILIDAAAGSIREVELFGIRINAPAFAATPAIRISGVQYLTVNAWVGYNTTNINSAIDLRNVGLAHLKHFKATHLTNVISTDSTVDTLVLEDCEYTTLNSAAGQTVIRSQASPNARLTVATLPAPNVGARAFVSDSSTTLSSDLGNVVAGGGSNFVPVYSDGSDWLIG